MCVCVCVCLLHHKREKKNIQTLFLSPYIVTCMCADEKYVHLATTSGAIYAFDIETCDVFHEFNLINPIDNKPEVPNHILFIDKNNEQLITANENGFIGAWLLHSKYPRQV